MDKEALLKELADNGYNIDFGEKNNFTQKIWFNKKLTCILKEIGIYMLI